MTSAGLPHSGIDGALPACGPPSLFAACHALHRPVSPRHPPHTGSCVRITVLDARQNSDHFPRDLFVTRYSTVKVPPHAEPKLRGGNNYYINTPNPWQGVHKRPRTHPFSACAYRRSMAPQKASETVGFNAREEKEYPP